MAKQKLNTAQTPIDVIQIYKAANGSLSTTVANIAFDTTGFTIGSKLTRSGSTVVIGAGVSYVRVSWSVMVETSATAGYIFVRLAKSGSELSQQIEQQTTAFKSLSESKIIPVTAGDTVYVVAEIASGAATLRGGVASSMTVEVIQ